MSGIQVATAPTSEPLTVLEAIDHLRLDSDVDETLVMSLIVGAREWAENYTGRAFITRTIHQWLDGFVAADVGLWEGWRTGPDIIRYENHIELAQTPVISLTHIKYFDDDDAESTWAATNYYVDTIREPARIVLRDGGTFPTELRAANGIKIVYEAGYGSSPLNVPEPIRLAMLQYCAFMYESRGDFEGNTAAQPPKILGSLLRPYQITRFGSTPFRNMVRAGIG
jgi:uncharacterized phiE125 gp8 family phage protein